MPCLLLLAKSIAQVVSSFTGAPKLVRKSTTSQQSLDERKNKEEVMMNHLNLSLPPVNVADLPRSGAGPPSDSNSSGSLVSQDSRRSAAVSPQLVEEGWQMLWKEFTDKLNESASEFGPPMSPLCVPSQNRPPPLSLASPCAPPSPFYLDAPPLTAHPLYPHQTQSPFLSRSFSSFSPMAQQHVPPHSAALNSYRDEQVFFGRGFDGGVQSTQCFQFPQPPPPGLSSSGESSSTYQQFNPMPRVQKSDVYSRKVFIGGIPSGTKSSTILSNFSPFGNASVDWPKRAPLQDSPPSGYAFVVYEEESSVCKLLAACSSIGGRTLYNFRAAGRVSQVEIKVWALKDSVYGMPGWRKYRRFSVFLGGLPRTCSAASLARVMQAVIGPVAYCTIELDRVNEYPKGAGCIVFCDKESYIKAVATHQLLLKFDDGVRQVEMKPFLASDMPCEKCGHNYETHFCNELICLAYFCDGCWREAHSKVPAMRPHEPMKRGRAASGAH